MIAQTIDLFSLHEIAIASALPNPTPPLTTSHVLTMTRSVCVVGWPSYTGPL